MPLSKKDLETRRGRITGTTAAGALGLHPWMPPIEAWARITGRLEGVEPNPAIDVGVACEPRLRESHARAHDVKIIETGTLVSVAHPWLAMTPDGLALKAKRSLAKAKRVVDSGQISLLLYAEFFDHGAEFKASGLVSSWARRPAGWGEEGSADVPEFYRVQCDVGLIVTGLPIWHLSLLAPGIDPDGAKLDEIVETLGLPAWVGPMLPKGLGIARYRIERDDTHLEGLVDALAGWYQDYVEADEPPPVDGDERTTKALRKLYPSDDGTTMLADADASDLAIELAQARRVFNTAESEKERLSNEFRALIGAASLVQGRGWKISNKQAKDSEKLDEKRLRAERPDIVKEYSKTVPGSRRLLPSGELFKKE